MTSSKIAAVVLGGKGNPDEIRFAQVLMPICGKTDDPHIL